MEKAEGGEVEAITQMTAELVSAYVSNNSLPVADLPGLIERIFSSLRELDGGAPEIVAETPAKPAVTIKKSITPDYLICLEDGKRLKMLKRHLRSTYNMTPDAYRTKWGLPPDYPMVAPNYAAQRSAFAKEIGLGRGAVRKPARRSARA